MIEKLFVLATDCLNPYENIAREEALLCAVPKHALVLYLWQNEKTVVIGRNQCAEKECDIAALERDGGHLARRLSGGGAVYHDLGNLNFTFLAHADGYDAARQTAVVAAAVRSFGIDVEVSGRNDLTHEGLKFSGNAYYQSGDQRYHHGTLMVSVDPNAVEKYLRVSLLKLSARQIASVRSRVTNLSEINPSVTVPAMKEALISAFEKEYRLPAQELWDLQPSAERIAFFQSPEFCIMKNPPLQKTASARFPWGTFSIGWTLCENRIRECAVDSEAMDECLISRLPECLTGCEMRAEALEAALKPLFTLNPGITNDIFAMLKERI